jgi:hypothetical protein
MDGLLRCARNDGELQRDAQGGASLRPRSHTGTRKHFFMIFVDGMFTTFVARLFTKTSHAPRQICAISCVMHARHAD